MKELESLCAWVLANNPDPNPNSAILANGVLLHLNAASEAARAVPLDPKKRLHLPRYGPLRERAMSNLDAAEAQLLNIASAQYVLGQMPSLLQHVRSHLEPSDPRREKIEQIARRLEAPQDAKADPQRPPDDSWNEARVRIVEQERGSIAAGMRAASSASLREQLRVRSFRNVLVSTTLVMTVLAIGLALLGSWRPHLLPLCFAPEEAGQAVVVCPTERSAPFATSPAVDQTNLTDIDDATQKTVRKWDLLVVELVGLTAGAVAAAAAVRGIRGSSERYGIPVALAALKLPTGAVTAVLGLLLMRGEFVPGLTALDTSAQIIAWALVFGYAQQLFTRLVDRQGQTVLDSVRGADKRRREPANRS